MFNFHRPAYLLISFISFSCSNPQQPINFGIDNCEFCKMTIVDNKFGGEIVTKKGKVYKFDSFECMIRYMKQNTQSVDTYSQLLNVDYANAGNLIDNSRLIYLHSEKLNSPMGAGLAAFSKKEDFDKAFESYNGENWNWQKTFDSQN